METKRVWVITGASSGLGLALASYVLGQGDQVIATVRTIEKFPEVLKDAGAVPLVVDFLSDDETLARAAEDAIKVYGYVDVLVNNAGQLTYGAGPVEELVINDIRKTFQTNLFGLLAFTQPFIQYLRLRKTGTIVNISSRVSYTVLNSASLGTYCATKAALNSFSDALQGELTPYGVRVFTVMPGVFPSQIFVTSQLSKVYTQEAQGYDCVDGLITGSIKQGLVGSPARYAARVFEVVTGTGFAAGLSLGEGERRGWTKIPVGTDSGTMVTNALETTLENVRALEALWSSTDLTPEELEALRT